jgi:integrase
MASIRKKGNSWEARVRIQGFSDCKSFPSKKEAQIWAGETETEMRRGSFTPRNEAEQTSLGDALRRYRATISPQKKGAKQEIVRIEAWLKNPLAKRRLASLRGKDFAVYRDTRLALGLATNTVRLELAIISHLFNIAKKEWGMDYLANPLDNVTRPKSSTPRDRRVDKEEEAALMEALGTCRNTLVKPLAEFAIETAMRKSEILSLTWKNVSLSRRVAQLVTSKNGDARTVPLSLRAVAILTALPKTADGPVFPISSQALDSAWARAKLRAGVGDLHFHDLRHEGTSRYALSVGKNLLKLQRITGHKTLQMLTRYTHLNVDDILQDMDAMSASPVEAPKPTA